MKPLFLITSFALLFGSCLKESRDKIKKLHGAKWTGTYAIAALQADLDLNDAVELVSGFANVGHYNDNTIYLKYENEEHSLYGYELVKIPNQSSNKSYALTTAEKNSLSADSVTISKTFIFPFIGNGISEVDSIWFNSGNLQATISNNYDHPCTGTLSFPDMQKGGQTTGYTFSIPARNQFNLNELLDLAHLQLTSGPNGTNDLRAKLDITWTNSGMGFTGSDGVVLDAAISNVKFSRIYGLFATNNPIQANNSLDIALFKFNLKNGTFNFEDPRFKLIVSNTTGIPINLATQSITAVYNSAPSTSITGYPANFDVAPVAFGNEGGEVTDSVVLTKSNSNIKTVVNNHPEQIQYELKIATKNNPPTRHFLLASSRISVQVALELPFYGVSSDIVLEDTVGFSTDNPTEAKFIDWISIRLGIENQMPLSIGFQGYFLDSQNNVIDSLFEPFRYFANSAKIDAGGNVVQPYTEVYDVTFVQDKIQHILNAKNLRIRAVLPTATYNGNGIPVKITHQQHFKVAVGIHTKLSVNETF